jgi:adenylyltransferase/sulfurtransferase
MKPTPVFSAQFSVKEERMSGFSDTVSAALSTFAGRRNRRSSPPSLNYPISKMLRCVPVRMQPQDYSMTDRLERFSWWNQARISSAKVLLVGAGRLGSNAAKPLVQSGIGVLDTVEPDLVDDSNRNRQNYMAEDVGRPKAHQLLKNVAPFAVAPTLLRGFRLSIQEFIQMGIGNSYDVILCGVDNDNANIAVAEWAARHRIPAVFVSVSVDGEGLRVFIQRPYHACFACYKPHALARKPRQPCIPVPAIADILFAAIGFAVRATLGEILGVPISETYNLRDVTFTGWDRMKTVERDPCCTICGGAA